MTFPSNLNLLPREQLPRGPIPSSPSFRYAHHKGSPMSSQRKLLSARANGAKSQGPNTEEGRRRSSANAIKHGLTAQTLLLPNEDPDEYRQMLDSYLQHFQPVSRIE